MADDFTYDAFLSHHHADKPRVRRLAERLRTAGLRVWFDEWIIQAGDDIYLTIERGLETARVQVLCLSPAALGSDWVTLERSTVLFRDPTNAGRRFIPLLLADCKLPYTLQRYKYVDFREETERAFKELLTACRPRDEQAPETAQPPRTEKPGRRKQRLPVVPRDPPGGFRLRFVLSGHKDTITRLAWSHDGLRLASAGQDGVIRIWDTDSGAQLQRLDVPPGQLREPRLPWSIDKWALAIAWTPAWSRDGRLIACGYGDAAIRLWDTVTGKIDKTLTGHRHKVNNVAWSPDGKVLASCADDSTVKLWDAGRGKCLATLDGHRGGINNVAWHPNGRALASGSLDGTIRLWDTTSHKVLRTLSGHEDIVITVVWSPDGNTLASSSGDQTICLWDAHTGVQQHQLEGHTSAVSCVAFSVDGRLLASKGIAPDSTVRFWRTDTWDVVATLDEPSADMWFAGIAFHPTRSSFASLGERDTAIRIWDLDDERLLRGAAAVRLKQYSSAKVVLLGESGVGKTTLAHRLIEDRYVRTESTHGMNVWPLDLPGFSEEGIEREVLLWDLAGQMSYREIHQLYLDETAVALLLINSQKEDPFADAGDWLRALDSAVSSQDAKRDVVRLLITTRNDVGGITVSQNKIRSFLDGNGLAGWLSTSAKTGENCSDKENGGKPSELKQLIARSIPWERLLWTSTPHLLSELRRAVVAMRDEADIRLLRFAELSQRLEHALPGETFGEADVRTAVTLLANHGLARPLKFGDLVLLRPDMLNGYAAAIIRTAVAHIDEIGCVLEADIYKPTFDFTGVERLNHRPDEELLLRAIVQMLLDKSLCIAEDTPQGRQLVFPSQYRREKDIPTEPDIFVSYTFGGEWQTVWTTLVVRLWYSQEFEHRQLWRNAAEFASTRGHTLGLKIDRHRGEGMATVSLYFDLHVPDELKVVFIEYVHRHLAKYARDVTRDRRYSCAKCGKPVKDLDAVRKRIEAKKDFITCQECDERVPFMDFIEQRLRSDPVARRILAMDAATTRELDTQVLEQILIGHMMAITGEANQIFRPVTMLEYGIDGEVEFRDNDGKASGKRIYVQLKSGNSYLRTRKAGESEVFDVNDERHLEYWRSQPVDVYLVVRQKGERNGEGTIRWMNVTRYLKGRRGKQSRHIVFDGEKLDASAVWKVRDEFFPRVDFRAGQVGSSAEGISP